MAIKITSDSTCDLSPELLSRYDVALMPLYVQKGEETFRDGIDIHPDDIFAHVAAGGDLCKTAAGNIDDYTQLFTKYAGEYDAVVHINISAEFSSSYQNACIAAEEFENVFVIDSRNLSSGQGHIVVEAAKMAEAGASAEEIVKAMNDLALRVDASFLVDKLDYLRKGGRCSALVAFSANMLKLKPSINMVDGELHVGKKYRGSLSKCLRGYVQDRLQGRSDIIGPLFITSSGCSEEVLSQVRALVAELQPDLTVMESVAGCTISAHCGPGTLGVLFVRR